MKRNLKKTIFTLCLTVSLLALTACSGKGGDQTAASGSDSSGNYRTDVSVQAVRDAVAEAYGENYYPNMVFDEETLAATYGVTADLYEEALGEGPMVSFQVDTLIIVKAKSGSKEAVQTALENYCQNQLDQAVNYPMNLPKIEASEVCTFGDYVCYVMLGNIDDTITDEEKLLTYCKEQNQIGVQAIEAALKAN